MKKVLCILMCAVLLLAMPTTAFAYTEYGGGGSPFSAEGETQISAKIYSSCVVSIPSTVEIYDFTQPTTCSVEINNANVGTGESVKVKIKNLNENNAIVLDNNGHTLNVLFSTAGGTEVTQYSPYVARISEFNEYGSASTYFNMTVSTPSEGAKAGNYEGTMQYEITINASME